MWFECYNGFARLYSRLTSLRMDMQCAPPPARGRHGASASPQVASCRSEARVREGAGRAEARSARPRIASTGSAKHSLSCRPACPAMALQALYSSGVGLRRILAHFPEDLSLAFAYGSAVYRQAGPSAYQEVSPRPPISPTSPLPGTCSPSPVPVCLPSLRSPGHAKRQLAKCSS